MTKVQRKAYNRRWYREHKAERDAQIKQWQKANRVTEIARNKEWVKANPDKAQLNWRRCNLRYQHGLSLEQYDLMFDMQGKGCAICKSKEPHHRRSAYFCVDHNHATGEIRGLLCGPCNFVLGYHETFGTPVAQVFLDYLANPLARKVLALAA